MSGYADFRLLVILELLEPMYTYRFQGLTPVIEKVADSFRNSSLYVVAPLEDLYELRKDALTVVED